MEGYVHLRTRVQPLSPLTCYLCTGVVKRMLGHREERGVPKGTHSYVDAADTGDSAAGGVRVGGAKL